MAVFAAVAPFLIVQNNINGESYTFMPSAESRE